MTEAPVTIRKMHAQHKLSVIYLYSVHKRLYGRHIQV